MGIPSARRDAAALLAVRLASNIVASRARELAEFERWRRRHAARRRQKLIRVGMVAGAVAVVGVVVAKVLAHRRPHFPDYEPATVEPLPDEPVQAADEPVPAA